MVALELMTLMTLLTPWAAQRSLPVLVAVRVLMGLGEGVSQPSIHAAAGAVDPGTNPGVGTEPVGCDCVRGNN